MRKELYPTPSANPRNPPVGGGSSELKAAGPPASLIPGRPWCLGLGLSSQLAAGLLAP